jgi:L-cysteate sulfo-lyase
MTKKLSDFHRVSICHQPTPLEEMPRLTEALGGPRLFIKRDDCTGLASGGNKTRKLEFLIADALEKGADILVTQGAVQSNHVRQTAAAACKFGLDCHALLERRVPDRAPDYEITGNVLLDHIFGASIEFRPTGLDMNAEALAVCESFAASGRKPYFIPGGGSNEIGALGYVSCALELIDQIYHQKLNVGWIVLASGSAGTHAGMLAGLHLAASEIPIMGISVRHQAAKQIETVHRLAASTAALLNDAPLGVEKVIIDDRYVGAGYGQPTTGTLDAINLIARREGLLLDPVYSGKGLAGLIGLVSERFFEPEKDVVFLHTGGSAALFAYDKQLVTY